ncbi:MAG: sulfatase-like hydrolase/transferase, partial [Planctomycetota bacterium]
MNELISRRDFLLMIAGSAAMPVLCPGVSLARERLRSRRKMNVLFIGVDDLRPQLGCYGQKHIISPSIDRLAGRGLVFERTYCQQAVCAPSRVSLLSGTRPDTTKIYDLNTPLRKAMPNVLTLPEHFKNNGYETISIGKIYHHPSDDRQGWTAEPYRAGTFPEGAWKGRGYLTEEAIAQMEEYNKANPDTKGRGPAFEAADVPDNVYPDG